MKYFSECQTLDQVKATYKKLAKQFHPDLGGDTATMQTINREYSFACASIAKGQGLSDTELNDQIKFTEQYRQVLEQIIHLAGIIIELVGGWIWVTGDTRAVKTELKAAGLFYAHKKCAWYYRSEEYKTRGGKKTLEEIKHKYGSETISRNYRNNHTITN